MVRGRVLLALALAVAAPPTVLADPPAPRAGPPRCPEVEIAGDGRYTWAPDPTLRGDGRVDWPVAPPDGDGWYDVQPFGENGHLGADLNARDGTRVGDPVYAAADGCVVFARDIWRGWGNVVRVVHELPGGGRFETLYAHLDEMEVEPGSWVRRGERIGTVGTAHGVYGPHLHFETRAVGLPQGHGYGEAEGVFDPGRFLGRP